MISKKLGHVLDQDPQALPNHPSVEQRVAFDKWIDDDSWVKYYVLASMSNELQSQYEHIPAAEAMIIYLQELYGKQSHTVHFEVSKRLFNMKICEG